MTGNSLHILSLPTLVFCLCLCSTEVSSQLSPGDLAEVHAHLEGLANCTKCHTLGKKVSNDKCLDCHDEIGSLISSNRGFHAQSDVRQQDCFACHSDHHGRKFDMVRFDTEAFDHDLTGYALTGKHVAVDCRSCHTPDNIEDSDIRKREDTYLGLQTDCASCHDDYHQGTLGGDCASCHVTDDFRPAIGFDHADTDFALDGAHVEVACVGCHEMSTRAGREFQEFADVEFATCASCHDDVHNGRFGANCAECHTTASFSSISGRTAFDHDRTDFPLLGSHAQLDCAACHDADAGADKAFTDFAHLDVINCTNCHDDMHQGRFGNDCASCHNVNSFKEVERIDEFDHTLTDFPLEGQHILVDCRECHEESLTTALAHDNCMDCHGDHHNGQFDDPECARCHTVEGFATATFEIGQHAETDFPLLGAHLATPCFECHLKGDQWQFANLGADCIDCHEDVHEGYLADSYYPEKHCSNCHNEESWTSITFDHSVTSFGLEGKHAEVSCGACHRDESIEQAVNVVFAGLAARCSECHVDPHGGQFGDGQGAIECESCHRPSSWPDLVFEHDSTRFALEGAHETVACISCHLPANDQEASYLVYRGTPTECAACHDQ